MENVFHETLIWRLVPLLRKIIGSCDWKIELMGKEVCKYAQRESLLRFIGNVLWANIATCNGHGSLI